MPRNNTELDAIFRSAPVPSLSEFQGEYFVDMLTMLPSLRSFSHRKVFRKENGKIVGCNILFTRLALGRFFVEEALCEGFDSSRAVLINYNVPENILFGRVRDYVRRIDEDVYLGRFNILLFGKPHFMGYFTLTRT